MGIIGGNIDKFILNSTAGDLLTITNTGVIAATEFFSAAIASPPISLFLYLLFSSPTTPYNNLHKKSKENTNKYPKKKGSIEDQGRIHHINCVKYDIHPHSLLVYSY